MTQVLVVFLIMLALVAAMSIGVIFGRKPIAGTCGGLNMMLTGGAGGGSCEVCGGNPARCDANDAGGSGDFDANSEASEALAHDATQPR